MTWRVLVWSHLEMIKVRLALFPVLRMCFRASVLHAAPVPAQKSPTMGCDANRRLTLAEFTILHADWSAGLGARSETCVGKPICIKTFYDSEKFHAV